jgi:hypothetical protein
LSVTIYNNCVNTGYSSYKAYIHYKGVRGSWRLQQLIRSYQAAGLDGGQQHDDIMVMNTFSPGCTSLDHQDLLASKPSGSRTKAGFEGSHGLSGGGVADKGPHPLAIIKDETQKDDQAGLITALSTCRVKDDQAGLTTAFSTGRLYPPPPSNARAADKIRPSISPATWKADGDMAEGGIGSSCALGTNIWNTDSTSASGMGCREGLSHRLNGLEYKVIPALHLFVELLLESECDVLSEADAARLCSHLPSEHRVEVGRHIAELRRRHVRIQQRLLARHGWRARQQQGCKEQEMTDSTMQTSPVMLTGAQQVHPTYNNQTAACSLCQQGILAPSES